MPPLNAPLDRPLFRSLDHCLKWAFRMPDDAIRILSVMKMGETLGVRTIAERVFMTVKFVRRQLDYLIDDELVEKTDVDGIAMYSRKQPAITADEGNEYPSHIVNFDLDPLHDLERAGERGMLQGFVRRQPSPQKLHLLCKYARGEERKEARLELFAYLLPLVNGVVRSRYVITELIARYYGRRVVFKDLSVKVVYLTPEDLDQVKRTRRAWRMVRDLADDIDGLLKGLATRTEELAHAELKEMGVII